MLHYEIPQTTGESYTRWTSICALSHGQVALMKAVATALDEGVFYQRDLDRHVIPQFAFTEEELSRGSGRVEGGVVGMEIYYARHRVEAEREAAAEREARTGLALTEGQRLGTLTLRHGKVVRNAVYVESATDALVVHYTRGNRRYRQKITARDLEHAMAQKGT